MYRIVVKGLHTPEDIVLSKEERNSIRLVFDIWIGQSFHCNNDIETYSLQYNDTVISISRRP